MAKRNVEEDILIRLDKFIFEKKTLPVTNDGKVNVSGLCKVLGLKYSDTQHFYRKEAIKSVVNALAVEQGALEIGARAEMAIADHQIENRIIKTAKKAKEDAQSAIEAKAQYTSMVGELRRANMIIEELRLENASLRERLDLVKSGVLVR